MDVSEREAARILRRIADDLEDDQELGHRYAQAVLEEAVRQAANRPTPQAPMAARNLQVRGSEIGPSAGGPPAEVAAGSEFGSSIYAQFQAPHTQRGYWLFPSAESPIVEKEGDKAIVDIMHRAARGF